MYLRKINLQTQFILEVHRPIERLHARIANINIRARRKKTLVNKSKEPVLDITSKPAPILVVLVYYQASNGNPSVFVDALVHVPGFAVKLDGSFHAVGIANRQLTAFVTEPKHQLLCRARSAIAFCVGGHEVEADVPLDMLAFQQCDLRNRTLTFVRSLVTSDPVVCRWDGVDGGNFRLQVLRQADERIALGDIAGAVDFSDVPSAVPSALGFSIVVAGNKLLEARTDTALCLLVVVHHVIDDPRSTVEDDGVVRRPTEVLRGGRRSVAGGTP